MSSLEGELWIASVASSFQLLQGLGHNKGRCWDSWCFLQSPVSKHDLLFFPTAPLFMLPWPRARVCVQQEQVEWHVVVSRCALSGHSAHFLSFPPAEPANVLLSLWGPEAAAPSWKVSCCFSTHSPGLPASFGAGWGVGSCCPLCAAHMPGLLLSCCSWWCSAVRKAVTCFCQMI